MNDKPLLNVKSGELWTAEIGLSLVVAKRDVSKIINLFIDFDYKTVIIEVIHQRDLLACDGKQLA